MAFGRIYEDDQEWKKAETHYTKLLSDHPEHELIKRRLAYVIYRQALDSNRQNNPDAALRLIARSEKLDPDLPGLASAKEVIEDNKKHARFLPELERAEEVYQSGRFDRAEKSYRALYAKWPRPAFLVRIADSLIQQGKEQEGFRLLEKAARENPSSREVREALYANFLRAGRPDEAKKGFQQIVESQEDAYYSHYKLGIIHLMDEDLEEAFDAFQTSLIYRPDFIPARLARGVALYEQGKEKESQKDFQEALKFDTFGEELARLNLALIDLNADEKQRARKSLEEIARMFPQFSDPHYHLSYMDFESGNYSAALKRIERAIELEKTDQYYLAKARILEKMPGQRVALEKTYRILLQDFPAIADDTRADVRQKLSRLSSGQARALSPLEMPAVAPIQVFRHRDLIIYLEKNRIVAARLGSESPEYIRDFSAPVMHGREDYWIYVAFRNRIESIDPLTGETVDVWDMPDVCRLLGGDGEMAAVTGASCKPGQEKELRYLDRTADARIISPADHIAPSAGTFHYADGFYHTAPKGNNTVLTRISWKGEGISTELQIKGINGVRRGDTLIVSHSAGLLYLDADDLEVQESAALPVKGLMEQDGNLIAIEDGKLHFLSSEGVEKTVTLPVKVKDVHSVHFLEDGQLLYVGADGVLRMLDASGKVLWKENPGKFDSRLLSVYY